MLAATLRTRRQPVALLQNSPAESAIVQLQVIATLLLLLLKAADFGGEFIDNHFFKLKFV